MKYWQLISKLVNQNNDSSQEENDSNNTSQDSENSNQDNKESSNKTNQENGNENQSDSSINNNESKNSNKQSENKANDNSKDNTSSKKENNQANESSNISQGNWNSNQENNQSNKSYDLSNNSEQGNTNNQDNNKNTSQQNNSNENQSDSSINENESKNSNKQSENKANYDSKDNTSSKKGNNQANESSNISQGNGNSNQENNQSNKSDDLLNNSEQENTNNQDNNRNTPQQNNSNENQSDSSINDNESKDSNKQSENKANYDSKDNTNKNNSKKSDKNNEINKEKLKDLKDKLKKYSTLKNNKLKKFKNNSSEEKIEKPEPKEVELSKENKDFMSKLESIPNFKERDRGDGLAIDTETVTEVNDSIIRTLINKFLNQRFLKKNTDLNIRSNSLEKSQGFLKWDSKAIIKHLETEQITKVLTDKYGYKYAEGKSEAVPLSFYFDLSGSMSNYTNMLAVIAIELLKKKVKVLVGFNEKINYQIDSITKDISVSDFENLLDTGENNKNVSLKKINRNIDEYLINSKAEKCVVFSDFDPLNEINNLSNYCQVYWFSFENNYTRADIKDFKGFKYKVSSLTDIANGLIKVNTNRFQSLIYMEEKSLVRR